MDPSTRERFRRLSIHEDAQNIDDGDADKVMKDPFSCAVYGEIDTLKELVQASGFDLDQKDSFGSTLLMEACRYGHENIVKYLLSKMVRIDTVNASGQLALHFASGGGYHEIVRVLLEHAAANNRDGVTMNVNAQDSTGKSALHWASKNDHDHCVRLLLAAKANPNLLDSQGVSAINWMSKFKSRSTMGTDSERDETLSSRDSSLTTASWMLKKSFPGQGSSIEHAPMGVSFPQRNSAAADRRATNAQYMNSTGMSDEDWNSEGFGGGREDDNDTNGDAELRRMSREQFSAERKFIEDALKMTEHVDVPEMIQSSSAHAQQSEDAAETARRERNRVVTFADEKVSGGEPVATSDGGSRSNRPMSNAIAARLAQMQVDRFGDSGPDENMSNIVVELDDDEDESMM